jgi:hypothetical protein
LSRQAEYAAWHEYAHDKQPVVLMNPVEGADDDNAQWHLDGQGIDE